MKKPRGDRIKKALVVFNPAAGGILKRLGDEKIIRKYLSRKKIDYIFFKTKKDKPEELDKFTKNKFDLILVAGGDGTLREVAHWLLKNKINSPLALLPSGTTNVYAWGLGIPMTIRRALRFAIKNKAIPQDIGIVNHKKYFLFAAGAGYSAKFAQSTSRRLKKIFGFPAYLIIAVAQSFNTDFIEGDLQINGELHHIKTKAFVIFNIRSALNVNPHVPFEAHPGVLDVLIADDITVVNVMRFAKRLTDEKRSIKQNQVKLITTKKLYFKSDKEIPMEIDGETWTGKELKIDLIPKAINIVCERQL